MHRSRLHEYLFLEFRSNFMNSSLEIRDKLNEVVTDVRFHPPVKLKFFRANRCADPGLPRQRGEFPLLLRKTWPVADFAWLPGLPESFPL